MKKYAKRFLILVLSCIMTAGSVYAAPTVNDLKEDKQDAQKELDSLENQLDSVMDKIYDLDEQMTYLNGEIMQATADLKEAEIQEQEQYEAMKCRIVAMYENGNFSTLELIFGAQSMTDMLKAVENVQTIHEYDRKELERFVETKEKIGQLKESLESEQAQVESIYQQQEVQMQKLNQMIEKQEDEVDAITKKLKEAEERAAREAAEREREEQENNPGGTGGGDGYYTGTGDSSVAAKIVASARSYLGVPYVWGGTSRKGIDCSGLTMRAHQAAGISIPRTSYYQRQSGKAINGLANALPGDILCYNGHVALYIGNGKVIHAPTTGQVVKVASWNMGASQPLLAIRRYW